MQRPRRLHRRRDSGQLDRQCHSRRGLGRHHLDHRDHRQPTGGSLAELPQRPWWCVVHLGHSLHRCWMVHQSAKKKDVPLAEVWNGTAWTVQATPHPTGAIVTKLTGVSCILWSYRVYRRRIVLQQSRCLRRHLGGEVERHQLEVLQLISQSRRAPSPAPSSSVSCSSAVRLHRGRQLRGEPAFFSLAEAWNGTAWALQTTPNSATTTGSVLDGVSCKSAASCTAVGFFDSPGGALSLAEAWNGQEWTIQATPNPPGPAAVSQFNGVSCSSATACTAVGFSQNSSSTDLTLAEGWNGTAWSIQPTPDPADADSFPGSVLSAISCSSATACMAVGNYTNTAGNVVTLAESWNGTAWKIETTLNPAGAQTTALVGVFCGSAADCTAVGRSFDAAGNQTAVVESWNGVAWTSQVAAVPSGATGAELSGDRAVALGVHRGWVLYAVREPRSRWPSRGTAPPGRSSHSRSHRGHRECSGRPVVQHRQSVLGRRALIRQLGH